jgi:beta-lactamase regulating signal transducer with metallopeptidase domain
MTWSQTLVITWVQFAVAAAALLGVARLALPWIRQPVERIRLIQFTVAAVVSIPVISALAPWPAWRLGLVAAPHPAAPELSRGDHAQLPAERPADNAWREEAAPIHIDEPRLDESRSRNVVHERNVAAARTVNLDVWAIAIAVVALVHLSAIVFYLCEWSVGKIRLRRLVHAAQPASPAVQRIWNQVTDGRGQHVKLLASAAVDTPLTFGWLKPVVVIPQSIAGSDSAVMRFCLAHEWTHVERADILSWRGMWVSQLLLWYQPLFWTLRRELRICQDVIADGRSTPDRDAAISYSEMLLGFAKKRQPLAWAGALGMFDHPSQLMRRITMLLQRPNALRWQCSWKFTVLAAVLAAMAAVAISGVRLDTARAEDQAKKPESKQQTPPAATTGKTAAPEGKPAEAQEKQADGSKEPVAAEDKAVHLTYQCVVVDKETGASIPNATVTVERSDSSSDRWPFKPIGKTTHVTDAEGKFTMEIPPEQSGNSSLYIQIYVEHDDYVRIPGIGYSLSMIRKNEGVGERPFFERLKLQPADPVIAKVVSPQGEPLAGVTIWGFTSTKARELNGHRWLETKTAADGSFRLNVMKGGVAFFWVMPDEYSIVQKFVSDQTGDLGEIRVPEGIRISGRSISADGKPVAGVAVNAYYQGKDNEPLQQYAVLSGIRRGAITDAEGRFTLDPLPPGDYRVVPEDELGDPRQERGLYPLPGVFLSQKTILKEGVAPPELELQAVPHVNFHAQYLDSQGKKRQGHEFFVHGKLDTQFWSARARPDTDGVVKVRLPHGLQDVQLGLSTNEHSALRHRKGRGQPIENHNHNVRLGTLNDDVEGFEIIRYKAPLVVVQAVDEAGQPIEDFQVVGHYAWMRNLKSYIASTTGSHVSMERQRDGRRRTSQMLPDEEVTFTVTAKGYESASETLTLPEGETKDLVLTLKKAAETKQE